MEFSELNDEELARKLQMEEEKEYMEFMEARRSQCDLDFELAAALGDDSFVSNDSIVFSEGAQSGSLSTRAVANSTTGTESIMHNQSVTSFDLTQGSHTINSSSRNDEVIVINDEDPDVSDCFEEFKRAIDHQMEEEEAMTAIEEDRERQAREILLTEMLENDEFLGELNAEEHGNDSDSVSEVGETFSTASSSLMSLFSTAEPNDDHANESDASSVSNSPNSQRNNDAAEVSRQEDDGNVMVATFTSAWNALGSAITVLSEFLSSAPTPLSGQRGNRTVCNDLNNEFVDEEDDDSEDDYDFEEDGSSREDDDDNEDFQTEYSPYFDEDLAEHGLFPDEIEILPTRVFRSLSGRQLDSHEQKECQVCLNEFTDGDLLRTLPCCHQFHSNCIDIWLKKDDICPVCRLRIRTELFA